jgi:isoleucyl-tRNA synthetase
LEAQLKLVGPAAQLEPVASAQEQLRELLNVSALNIEIAAVPEVTIHLAHAEGSKCERCWHWEKDVGSHLAHPSLCARCVEALG